MSEHGPEQSIDFVALAKDFSAWVERVVKPALVAIGPHISEIADGFERANERRAFWDKNAPDILKRSVTAAGLIVPFSQMSYGDYDEMMVLYEAKGDQAVVDRVLAEYDAVFANERFIAELAESWAQHPRISRRMPILRQALRAHEQGLFAVSVPTFIAQFEGLVADTVQHPGRMSPKKLREHAERLGADAYAFGAMFSAFVCDAYLETFEHGQTLPMPALSRHAILHGGDINYATETNSRTMIFLIDALRDLTVSPRP